jgi:hypothetical protein
MGSAAIDRKDGGVPGFGGAYQTTASTGQSREGMSQHAAEDRILARSAILQSSASFIWQESMAELGHTGNDYQYETRSFIHPKTGQPTAMDTSNIGRSETDMPATALMLSGTSAGRRPGATHEAIKILTWTSYSRQRQNFCSKAEPLTSD